MTHLFRKYQESNINTKWFIWTGIIYGVALILSTLYAYMRLDFIPDTDNANREQTTQTTE